MFNNYIKVSIRRCYREKLYTLINISGLSLAISCCIILGLYLRNELTYDLHNTNHKQIYRANYSVTEQGVTHTFALTSPMLGPMITPEFDEIEDYVRLRKEASRLVRYENDAYYWDTVYIADDNIFDVFTHTIIYGDPKTALKNDATVAISETFSKRYFGDENPVGKTVRLDAGAPLTIKLVFADLPDNSHVKYDLLITFNRPFYAMPENLTQRRSRLRGVDSYTYLVFKEGFKPENFKQISDAFYERHMAKRARALESESSFHIQALADVHFQSNLNWDLPTGNFAYLYAFSAVAVFILMVACINYTNLSTARSVRRAKDVGMRKILGARKSVLMLQFLVEAMLFAFVSVLLGIMIVEMTFTLAPINTLLGTSLKFSLIDEPDMLGWLTVLCITIGFISGIYPALYLSSWAPVSALVGNQGGNKGNIRLRQGLVLTQFTISIAVIVCTLLMADQMRYLSNKPLGFDKENRIAVRLIGGNVLQKVPVIKGELLKHPDILGVAASRDLLGTSMYHNGWSIESEEGAMHTNSVEHMSVDLDYMKTMGIKLIAGRDFSQRFLTDVGTSFIVNEAFVSSMGWSQPIGKRINIGRVIGVVEDFHYQSLHSVVSPFAMYLFNDNWVENPPERRPFQQRYLTINVAAKNIPETLAYLENRFSEFDPKHPFEFVFLDESLDALYRSDRRLMQLIGIFSGICIFIACLGLFGLTSYTTEQRNKEIGIRKVLGASASQIIFLLSRSILLLVIVGAILASIVAYFMIDEWLNGFSYRTEIGLIPFIISTIVGLIVAYVTVALHSLKTAYADPVDALRYE